MRRLSWPARMKCVLEHLETLLHGTLSPRPAYIGDCPPSRTPSPRCKLSTAGAPWFWGCEVPTEEPSVVDFEVHSAVPAYYSGGWRDSAIRTNPSCITEHMHVAGTGGPLGGSIRPPNNSFKVSIFFSVSNGRCIRAVRHAGLGSYTVSHMHPVPARAARPWLEPLASSRTLGKA